MIQRLQYGITGLRPRSVCSKLVELVRPLPASFVFLMRENGMTIWVRSLCAVILVHAVCAAVPAIAADAERGRVVYKRACAACHGNAGDGKSAVARYLDPRPRDFTLGFYKFNSTPAGLPPTDKDLYRTIQQGIPTTSMPAFRDLLSNDETLAVVEYIKSLSDNFTIMPASEPVTIPDPPPASAKSIADGKSIYMMTGCWTCHGPTGTGEGDAATILKDASGFEVRPVDFTQGRYKAGSDSESIYRSIETGFVGTPMAGFGAAFAYGRDSVSLPSKLETAFGADEIAAAQAYLDAQPTRAELNAMSPEDKARLVAERKWALVRFLESLAEEPSIWHRLFWADTEVTQ